MTSSNIGADSPEELLQLLTAHAFGEGADGVNRLFELASGKLRGRLGSLDVFHRAFSNELYAPLLRHDELRADPPTVIGNSARAQVTVRVGTETAVYQVGLVRTENGQHAGRWLLSGVFREGVDL